MTIEPRQDPYSPRKKNFIIINARSHSGETSGSWVLDGFLEALSVDREMQEWMIKLNICFRIVPMLNKDGVFIGNYRTGVVGDDFNRKFATGQREFFP
jgi:murein tripeptide amidase MpaA